MANISLEWLKSLLFIYSLMEQKSYSKSNLYSFLADQSHYKLLIERLQQVSTKAEEDPSRDASDFMTAEEVVDLTPGTNNMKEEAAEVATTKQDADVKAQEDSVAIPSPEQSDDSDDDFQKWSQYKSAY
ncbi:Transcription factor TFIIIB component B'' [Spatholobus suberectus]|nr:Transcription factor TFIIIB component B'' [Spatholobus suberectus]